MIHFGSSCRRDFRLLDAAYRLLVADNVALQEQFNEEKSMNTALRKTISAEQQLRECAEEMRLKDQLEMARIQKEFELMSNEITHSRLEVSELYDECQLLRTKVEAFEALQLSEPYESKQYRKRRKSEELQLQG